MCSIPRKLALPADAMVENHAHRMVALRLSSPFLARIARAQIPSSCSLWVGQPAFLSAMKGVAAKKKIVLPADVAVDAEIDLGKASGGFLLQARLNVSLPGLDGGVAEALVESADQECPYSKATRGNINTAINVVAAQPRSRVT